MSGQLVGEVIASVPMLQKRGVPERGFQALIAIAEKCNTQTRRGSVRWDHIRDGLYGASHRTAQRAVQDLLTAGVLEVVKPGFGNQYGRTCAPIYRIAPLVDDDTWMAQSTTEDDDTQMSRSNEVDDDKSKVDDDKPGSGSRHPGVVLDVPIDVPIDVKERAAREHAATLVNSVLPNSYPQSTIAHLTRKTAEMLDRGDSPDVVHRALEIWDTKPDAGPGLLPHLVAEAAKSLKPKSLSAGDQKVDGWLNLDVHLPGKSKELT